MAKPKQQPFLFILQKKPRLSLRQTRQPVARPAADDDQEEEEEEEQEEELEEEECERSETGTQAGKKYCLHLLAGLVISD